MYKIVEPQVLPENNFIIFFKCKTSFSNSYLIDFCTPLPKNIIQSVHDCFEQLKTTMFLLKFLKNLGCQLLILLNKIVILMKNSEKVPPPILRLFRTWILLSYNSCICIQKLKKEKQSIQFFVLTKELLVKQFSSVAFQVG